MEKFETAALGAVQGVTEFFPVSSTAHLMIFSWLFSWKEGGLDLAVWLHAGTLAAVLVCFRKDWLKTASGFYRAVRGGSFESREAKMGAGLAVATLPAVACGLAFEAAVAGVFRSPPVVCGGLLAGSAALFFADRKPHLTKRLDGISISDCLIFGVAQCFAFVPGVSRSGASITGGMLLGYTREDSAKFAFMMGVPAICAAIARTVWKNGFSFPAESGAILGAAAAAVSGIFAIRFLMRFAKSGSYLPFVIYRVIIAAGIMVFVEV